MLTDETRLDGYVKALKNTITEDSIVLDLGAGTGIFSVLACEFGAKKVYALEANPLIKLLQDVVEDRGYADRIEIIQKLSSKVDLSEKANVLISDIHGGFPLFESSLETIIDARDRLLSPNAKMIPGKERVYFAISQSDEIYKNNVQRYLEEFYGFSIPSAERLVFNRWFSAEDKNEKLLSDPDLFCEIDHQKITETSFEKHFEWEIQEDGVAHGLRGWFENELSEGNMISNSISVESTTYARPFFPFEKPVEVKEGDVVSSFISAKYEKGDYAWSWRTEFKGRDNDATAKIEFNQSVLASMFIEPSVILKQSEFYTPKRNENAEIDLFILSSMDGDAMQGDIADLLVEKFPRQFKSPGLALNYAADMARKYSE